MPTYNAIAALPNGEPGPWGDPVTIRYDQRDVLLYAVGIGLRDLRYVYEGNPQFAVFPTFSIRWGGAGVPLDTALIPASPGPLNIDAERYLEVIKPLPTSGEVTVQSRFIAAHPRGKGNGFLEFESLVRDSHGEPCVKLVNGSFRRGIKQLGDIEPFEGVGQTFSQKIEVPGTAPDIETAVLIPDNQAHIYRLSGDYNSLHIDPEAARFGGFDEPILHGLCTFGHSAQMLLQALCDGDASRFKKIKVRFSSPVFLNDTLQIRAWRDGPGRVIFEGRVGDKVVVSNAYFEYAT
ncbi:MAG: MaoC/PaaZ C-terminal domain-containing protein [Proteobacteria bacterium]|jgi:peroxisomal enoyl-CoA hydratase 2|nr:MaoC/PaaZ C-terminal domain-containing protein [Pseudomonadota bacterium]MDA1299013.1 MaoC/PaaZ C-terminal domain-containing protein [Pseudomonadota bacterium]